MAKLKDVIAYFCKNYPHKEQLYKARLTKMVYLADWKSAIDLKKQMTDIKWIFTHYGPYVEDVIDLARKDPDFKVETIPNLSGNFSNFKELVKVKKNIDYSSLDKKEMEILDKVIEVTKKRDWIAFTQFVYSTYPILTQDRYSELDLVALAKKYKEDFPQFHEVSK